MHGFNIWTRIRIRMRIRIPSRITNGIWIYDMD